MLNAISVHQPEIYPQTVIDSERRNQCWNDKKVDAHHAIIPTARASKVNLTQDKLNVYGLVVLGSI